MCDLINHSSDLLAELSSLWRAPRVITRITFPGVPNSKVVVPVRRVPGYSKPKQSRMVLPSHIFVRLADADANVLPIVCQSEAYLVPSVLPVPHEVLQQAVVDMVCNPRPVSQVCCQSPIHDDDIYGENTPLLRDEDIYA